MPGPSLTFANWLLSALPIVVLMVTMLGLKWSAPKSGGLAFLIALALAFLGFGGNATTTAIASAKGLSLSLFVLSIVWTSVYLYNIVDRSGGIDAIGRTMARLSDDKLAQALLLGWGFSGFIQGITGFGVPVAVTAPLLVMVGFPLARAAAIALVGHGWAVTFGSLGSSYYSIQLVTGIPGETIGPHMALLFALPTIASGLAVAHIQGGMSSVRRSLPIVLVVGSLISVGMWLLALLGAPQIASAVPGLIAVGAIGYLSRTPLLRRESVPQPVTVGAPQDPDVNATEKPMSFHTAFIPYYSLIALSVISQIGPIKEAAKGLAWGLDYPGFITGDGFVVAAATDYAVIRLLNHPAPLILASVALAAAAYAMTGRWRRGTGMEALRLTYNQSLSTTVGVSTMVMMALVMADTGMTTLLANGIAEASGPLFPLVSPFIGTLGAFMTGSNTNSNVMLGLLQVETARALDIGTVTIASIQSVGASFGSSLAPAKVLVGAALVGLSGRENEILRLVIPYVLLLVLLAGLEALLLVTLIPGWTR
jgi:lactate permease